MKKVEFKGYKLIKKNKYKKIRITEYDDKYRVEAIGLISNSLLPRYKKSESNVKSELQLVKIIKSFIDNNKIKYYDAEEENNSEYSNYCIAKGDKEIEIKLKSKRLKLIFKLLEDKYYSDRLDFCKNNDDINIYNFFTHYDRSYYKRKKDKTGEYINFHIKSKRSCLDEKEKEFMISLIKSELEKRKLPAEIANKTRWSNRFGYINLGYKITCGNLRLKLYNSSTYCEAADVVKEHNKKLELKKER